MATKEKETAAATPDGWPVSFSLPTEESSSNKKETLDFEEGDEITQDEREYATLQPGPCLQACNGSDVQLARGASSRPNLAKGKGRYLIILPGIMSLKPRAKATKTPAKDATQDSSQGGTDDLSEMERPDAEQAKPIAMSLDPADDTQDEKSKRPPPAKGVTLGKIENLQTDHPVLKVPFEDGRTMVFHGKKFDSSSKFMILHCKSSKGSVTCTDIFSSAIVFGEVTWENANGCNAIDETENGKETPFRHYGGSVRTVDGGKFTKNTGRAIGETNSVKKQAKKRPSVSKAMTKKFDEKEEDEMESESEREEVGIVNDGSDSEGSYVEMIAPVADVTPRSRSARKASQKAKQKLKENDEDTSEDEEVVSEEDESEPEERKLANQASLDELIEESWSPEAFHKPKPESDSEDVKMTEPTTERAPWSKSSRSSSKKATHKMEVENCNSASGDDVVVLDNDASDYEETATKRGRKSSQKTAPTKVRAGKKSRPSVASRKRKQASESDAETTEPPVKSAPRSSSARKASQKAKQKMEEESGDSSSHDEVAVLGEGDESTGDEGDDESDYEETTTKRGQTSIKQAAPTKSRAAKASRKRKQASDSNVETPELATKRAPRSSSARKKANQKLEEENGESSDEVVVLDDEDDDDDDFENDDDESDYKEATTRRGRQSTKKAKPAKSRAKSKLPVEVDLTNDNDADSRTLI